MYLHTHIHIDRCLPSCLVEGKQGKHLPHHPPISPKVAAASRAGIEPEFKLVRPQSNSTQSYYGYGFKNLADPATQAARRAVNGQGASTPRTPAFGVTVRTDLR